MMGAPLLLTDEHLHNHLAVYTAGPCVSIVPRVLLVALLRECLALRLIEAAARQAATGPVAQSARGLEVLACELTVLDLERAGGMQGVGDGRL